MQKNPVDIALPLRGPATGHHFCGKISVQKSESHRKKNPTGSVTFGIAAKPFQQAINMAKPW